MFLQIATTIKWLQKLYEVRVVITAGSQDGQKSEKIIGALESKTKEIGKIVQKRNKEGTLRFSIMPILKKDQENFQTPEDIVTVVEEIDEKNNDPEDASSPPAKLNKIQARSYHTLSL